MDKELSDEEIIEEFTIRGYYEGLIHGFTLGRGKPPRPEDMVNIRRMTELTRGKLVEMLRRERTIDATGENIS